MSPNHMWGHGVAAVMLSGDAAESDCWGYSNILGDLVAPPSDSGAVLGFLDAEKCVHRGSIRPGLLPSGWSASQTPHIAHFPPSLHLSSWSVHVLWYTFVLRGSGPRTAEMLQWPIAKYAGAPSLLSGPGTRKGVLAPSSWGQGYIE